MTSTRPLFVATTNAGKIAEITQALAGTGIQILTLADVPPVPEPEENGETFADNAWLKAQAYAAATGLATLAEDSGLEIDALEGRPGVLSARYPGETYPEKFENLYRELAHAPKPWTAHFVSALALAEPGVSHPRFAGKGIVTGAIVQPPRGTQGFGYDPIFEYSPGKTGGEMSRAEKLTVSHRGRALELFRRWLDENAFSG